MNMKSAWIIALIPLTVCFNISPVPNIVFRKPNDRTEKNQTRSSYFGYSIKLRSQNLLVGAPRAQSIFKNLERIEEPGAVFKCNLESKLCEQYDLDTNVKIQNPMYTDVIKDYQLFGASMDGNEKESDKFVACSPMLKLKTKNSVRGYHYKGSCVEVANTLSNKPETKLIQPQFDNANSDSFIASGFSVHVSKSDEIIVSSPGNQLRNFIHRKDNSSLKEFHTDSEELKDSNFGYALTSGMFMAQKKKLNGFFYVASAPKRKGLEGEVILFTFSDSKINIIERLSGSQNGEYFGYSILAEDFNKDGFLDLAVSAPLYTKNNLDEHGAVYVFIHNKRDGFKAFNITSEYPGSGRFGSAMSKIGDINLDGYNDIAVSAPLEGDGVVYIYLGTKTGLDSTPSQKITPPALSSSSNQPQMFGYAISTGVDIDSNGYKDIAISSPVSETVYVFKTYPVVILAVDIKPWKTELYVNETSFSFQVCAQLNNDTKQTKLKEDIEFELTIKLDTKHNRAKFAGGSNKSQTYNISLGHDQKENCSKFDLNIIHSSFNYSIEPLTIEAHWKTLRQLGDLDGEFCETCAVLNRNLGRFPTEKKTIKINTGCEGSECHPNLGLNYTLVNVTEPLVIGAPGSDSVLILYEISNSGKVAFNVKLNVTIVNSDVRFSKVPPLCYLYGDTMTCDIKGGRPMAGGSIEELYITLDTTKLDYESLSVEAFVVSAVKDEIESDNEKTVILLAEKSSEVIVKGASNMTQLLASEHTVIENVKISYKIFNNGPSPIKTFTVGLRIPISYIPEPKVRIHLVDLDKLLKSLRELSSFLNSTWTKDGLIMTQTKENISNALNAMQLEDSLTETSKIKSEKSPEVHQFDCSSSPKDVLECMEVFLSVTDLQVGGASTDIDITLPFSLLRDDLFNDQQKSFAAYNFTTNIKFHPEVESEDKTVKVSISNPHITITKGSNWSDKPIWIYVVGVIAGFIFFDVVAWIMYKLGFFKRTYKMELDQKIQEARESVAINGSRTPSTHFEGEAHASNVEFRRLPDLPTS